MPFSTAQVKTPISLWFDFEGPFRASHRRRAIGEDYARESTNPVFDLFVPGRFEKDAKSSIEALNGKLQK